MGVLPQIKDVLNKVQLRAFTHHTSKKKKTQCLQAKGCSRVGGGGDTTPSHARDIAKGDPQFPCSWYEHNFIIFVQFLLVIILLPTSKCVQGPFCLQPKCPSNLAQNQVCIHDSIKVLNKTIRVYVYNDFFKKNSFHHD